MHYASASVLVLVYVSSTLLLGVSVFLSGFLLRRVALPDHTVCAASDPTPCRLPVVYRRAVLLVVDALRDDFLDYDETLDDRDALPYQNRMPLVRRLLADRRGHAVRYRFVADPPTTTMQRLKALTTGTLPTFVDVSDNFASYVVAEDSWLWQLNASGGAAEFAGDDTWLQLFPDAFRRAAPFPSLDIRDLDTVDVGVRRYLLRRLGRRQDEDDWTLLVGHMLGVDHCGHTYGPRHPQMARKLAEVDALIWNITESLDNDTILFVLGDHGMTITGDHGGDSADEVGAGLLVVSGRPLPTPSLRPPAAIPQVDLVPTLSVLLGLPVPFSSLGTVRCELLPPELCGRALAANVQQVAAFLRRYDDNSLPQPAAPPPEQLQEDPQLAEDYLRRVRVACSQAWATFSPTRMAAGLVVLATAGALAAVYALVVQRLVITSTTLVSVLARVLVVFGAALSLMLALVAALDQADVLSSSASVMAALVACVALAAPVGVFALRLRSTIVLHLRLRGGWLSGLSVASLLASAVLASHGAGFFSNSFTVHEDAVSCYGVVSLLLARLMCDPPARRRHRWWLRAALTLTVCCLVRVGRAFSSCREEQLPACDGWLAETLRRPLSVLAGDSGAAGRRLATAAGCLLATVWSHRLLLRRCGALNGHSVTVLAARWCCPLAAVALLVSWLLQALPVGPVSALLSQQQRRTPALLTAYSCLTLLVVLLCRPLLVYVRPADAGPLVERLFHRLRRQLAADSSQQLRVYGLAAGVTAPLSCAALAVWLSLLLLLGDGLVAPATAALVTHALTAWLLALSGTQERWLSVVLWCELASHHFFSTGHQATFASIQWDAAFTGLLEPSMAGSTLLPAICVVLNTFAGELLAAVTLPALVFTPALVQYLTSTGSDVKSEFDLLLDGDGTMKTLLDVNILYLCAKTVKLVCSCLAAAILRRHLMVWKIFAPRVMFEASSFLVAAVSAICVQCLVLRTIRYGAGWVDRLSKRQLV